VRQPLTINKMLSFWRGYQSRVKEQMTVWLNRDEETDGKINNTDRNDIGARKQGVILPRLVSAGTVTRRATEKTWMTATNPLPDRIGSELKAMVQAPDGYCFVGADVDSQELWIASLLGDANFTQIHGSTALGWMTLQGKKSDGTDMHSKTASTIGCSRGQAKVFNYSRIYGAGRDFTVNLLRKQDPRLSLEEADAKADKLYESTKGVKRNILTVEGLRWLRYMVEHGHVSPQQANALDGDVIKNLTKVSGVSWNNRNKLVSSKKIWQGGTESFMFNELEKIATSKEPRTPVLGCLISKALLPENVGMRYLTSRVNWVVQSSGVDYLHIMLTCMQWLISELNIDARFAISIHDEVRYLVAWKDRYRAAMALQVTNLLTRSLFAHALNMHDLPQSVAFFSSIDIDKVLRKEVDFDCQTPSNLGGMHGEYNIPIGEALNIYELIEKMNAENSS